MPEQKQRRRIEEREEIIWQTSVLMLGPPKSGTCYGNYRTATWEEWKTPQPDFVKINTDAAVNGDERRSGRARVASGDHGRILKCWAINAQKMGNAWMEETLRIWEAMIMAKEEGWNYIIKELDRKGIVDKLVKQEIDDLRYQAYEGAPDFELQYGNAKEQSLCFALYTLAVALPMLEIARAGLKS
ncbi:hypothetical protein ACH5RR_026542 [Cinchona calisaya]|uniref:RNase H type-1 domain-containing protein n=1 Tax=Cinchona calisaya TaxID=153742 RepID=A0ABD2Z698_9GENT